MDEAEENTPLLIAKGAVLYRDLPTLKLILPEVDVKVINELCSEFRTD